MSGEWLPVPSLPSFRKYPFVLLVVLTYFFSFCPGDIKGNYLIMTSNTRFGTIRYMIKLWWLMWYFTRQNRPSSLNQPSWQNKITRGELITYLLFEKHFREYWSHTVLRWFNTVTRRNKMVGGGLRSSPTQRQEIKDLIDEAIKKELLLPSGNSSGAMHPIPSEVFLITDYRGRHFIRPLIFIEACAREYGFFASILTSFIIGIGGTLLVIFWDNIKLYLGI